jgi:hypothetical protein
MRTPNTLANVASDNAADAQSVDDAEPSCATMAGTTESNGFVADCAVAKRNADASKAINAACAVVALFD